VLTRIMFQILECWIISKSMKWEGLVEYPVPEMTRYTVWAETGNSADYADRPNCCQVDAFGALEGGR